jgi:hypothetical protein
MEILWHREMNAALQAPSGWTRVRELAIWGLDVDPGWDAALARLMEAEIALDNPHAAIVWAEPLFERLKKARRPIPRQLVLLRDKAEAARDSKYAREAASPERRTGLDARREPGTFGHTEVDRDPIPPLADPAATRAGRFEWDIFLASPMDAFPDDDLYEGSHRTVTDLVSRLRTLAGLERIFFAGQARPTRGHFNDPSVSLRGNLLALRTSRTFVMIHPDRLLSSTIVEATFALAWEIPGILFVRRRDDLPFLLRSVTDVFPTMLVRTFVDFDDLMDVLLAELPCAPLPGRTGRG